MSVRMPRRWVRWVVGAVVIAAALAVGGPFLYIHFFNGSAPAALSLSSTPTASATSGGAPSTTTTTTSVAGTWTVGSGSTVGYRVSEVLLGQSATAVGRSNSVTGHITIQGTTVSAATFSVPERTATTIEVQGSIPVLFSNWGISNPSIGGFVTTQDHGLLEFLLVSRKG